MGRLHKNMNVLMSLNCTLKNDYDGNVLYVFFTTIYLKIDELGIT